MKPTLILGSTCVDLILTIDCLPKTGDDLDPSSQTLSVGGCAYNVAHMFRLLGASHTFVTPIGGGLFGERWNRVCDCRRKGGTCCGHHRCR